MTMTIEEIIKDVPSSKYDDIVVEIIKINDISAFPDNDDYIYTIKPQRVIRTTRWLHKLSNVPITTEVGVPTFGKKRYYEIDTHRIKKDAEYIYKTHPLPVKIPNLLSEIEGTLEAEAKSHRDNSIYVTPIEHHFVTIVAAIHYRNEVLWGLDMNEIDTYCKVNRTTNTIQK